MSTKRKLDQGKGEIWWHPRLSRAWHTDHSWSRFRELIIVTEVYKGLSRCIIFIQQTHSLTMLCVCAHVYLSVCLSMWSITFVICLLCFVRGDHGYTDDHLGCHCSEATHLILEGSLTNLGLADSSRLAAQRTPKILLSLSSWHCNFKQTPPHLMFYMSAGIKLGSLYFQANTSLAELSLALCLLFFLRQGLS